jgi:protein SFI1
MRSKMKVIRDKRELKLMKDALTKWRQSHRTYSADRHYTRSLILRHHDRWRKRLAHLDHLDDVADRFSRVIEGGVLEKFWHRWKHASQLQLGYKIVTDNIGLRVKTEVMDVWRRQMWASIATIPTCFANTTRRRDNHNADAYYNIVLKKTVLRSWKSARDRLRARSFSCRLPCD